MSLFKRSEKRVRFRHTHIQCILIIVLFIIFAFIDGCQFQEKTTPGWRTFRYDNRHTGYSPETLSPPLALCWTRQSQQAPEPAWPKPGEEMQRMQMDNAFHSTMAYGTIYFGSSLDHSVHALDMETGKEKWHFSTEGPVRYAPSLFQSRVYFGSDDGYVYCLDAKNGRLLWKYRAGPTEEKVIGNGSMISLWPIRTNVLTDGDVVYFGAGVFPFEGIYICALDARDGSIIWKNDTIGDQEHELIFGGISPQGYLVCSESILYIPSSRAMPAAFDKKSGEFLYYLEPRGKIGGTWTVIDRENLIAGVDLSGVPAKAVYEGETGERKEDMHAWFPGIDLVVTPWTSFALTKAGIYALNREKYVELQKSQLSDIRQRREQLWARLRDLSDRLATADQRTAERIDRERNSLIDMLNDLAQVEDLLKPELFDWEYLQKGLSTIILVGEYIYAGGEGLLLALDGKDGQEVWRTTIEGTVKGLSAADGYLLVSTDKGSIVCFSQDENGSAETISTEKRPVFFEHEKQEEFFHSTAVDIIEQTGIKKGYALVMGCETGGLALELAKASELYVVGLTENRKKAQSIRQKLFTTGFYGHRLVVADWKLETLPDYFANLVVSEKILTRGEIEQPAEEVFRLLKPHGGVAAFGDQIKTCKSDSWVFFTRGGLEGSGKWTEEYGNPGNTACSGDKLVKGPLGILWFGEPGSEKMLDRHAKAQSPLALDGRLFIQGEEFVMAYDAYNGTLLWEKDMAGAVRARADVDGGNFSVNKKGLFIGAFDRCYRLDPASGEELAEFPLPDTPAESSFRWAHVSATDTHLFGSRAQALNHEYFALKNALVEEGKWKTPDQIPLEFLDQYEALRQKYPDPSDGLLEDFKRSGALWRQMIEFPDWENYKLREGALTDRILFSDLIFAMNPETGQLKWKYQGKKIAHITICKGNNKIFFAESDVNQTQKSLAMRDTQRLIDEGKYEESQEFIVPLENRDFRTVIALDAETGDIKWQKILDFSGCGGDTLASACHNGVLLFFSNMGSHDAWRHKTGTLRWKRLTALDANTGEVLWSHPNNYRTRPVVVGERIYIEPRACDLRTGEILTRPHPISGQQVPFEYLRPGHTCAISSASASMLFYRSACAAITDFEKDNGLTLFGGIRPGCWINMIPASGVLLFPEASAGCTCSYPLRGSVVLKHKPDRWEKGTVFITHGPLTPVKHFAINLGASSDRKDDEGIVWFAYPNPDTDYTQNHYPNYGVKFNLNEKILSGMGFFNRDFREVTIPESKRPWLFTSGAVGVSRFEIPLIDDIWGESPGSYTVKLGFKAPGDDKKGQRIFDVKILGEVELEDFDIRAEAGSQNRAVVIEFPGVLVENILSIEFLSRQDEPGLNEAPLVNFIEVIREDEIEETKLLEKTVSLKSNKAETLLSSADVLLGQKRFKEALEKYHAVLEGAPSEDLKKLALDGMARIGDPESLRKIAIYCKNLNPIMRDYKVLSPELKRNATRVFVAIADAIASKDRDKAVDMMDRAIRFSDPEDLEILQEITSRLKILRENDTTSRLK